MFEKFKKQSEQEAEEQRVNNQLISDMKYVRSRLGEIRRAYNMVADGELIDSLIYEENALVSRYNYMLRLAKERNLKNIPTLCT